LTASAAAHYEDLSVGGDIKYELEDQRRVKEYNFGLAYKIDQLQIAALVEKNLSTAKIGIHHKVNNKTCLAYEFSHNLIDKNCDNFDVTAGFAHKIDYESDVKVNLKMSGVASIAYKVKVKPEVTLTVSLENSVKELANDGKIGFEVAYESYD